MGSEFVLHQLVAPRHVESSWTRDWTCVPCIGRWILNHWTPQQSLMVLLKSHSHVLQDALPSLSTAEAMKLSPGEVASQGHSWCLMPFGPIPSALAGPCTSQPHITALFWAHPLFISEGLGNHSEIPLPTLVALTVKNLPAEETWVHSQH